MNYIKQLLASLTVSNGVTALTAIIGALSALGNIPHANAVTTIGGFAILGVVATIHVINSRPKSALDAIHSFAEAISNDVTPEQKAIIIQIATQYLLGGGTPASANPPAIATPAASPSSKK
jgi:hypothetical protein